MEEILHQLIWEISHYLPRFYTSQVVQDFSHQQYHSPIQPFPKDRFLFETTTQYLMAS